MSDTDGLSAQDVLAKTIYGEARNQSHIGKVAIAAVVLNRVKHGGWWGHDIKSVCLKPYQFSCWLVSDPNRSIIMAATPKDPVYAECYSIAGFAIIGDCSDPTGGSTSYCTLESNPKWSIGITPTIIIENHKFYKI